MEIKSIQSLVESINQGYNSIYAYGLIENATGHFVYSLLNKIKRPVFVVLENDKKARSLYEDLENKNIPTSYLADIETNYNLLEDLDYTNRAYRMNAISDLINGRNKIIVASRNSITKKLMRKDEFEEKIIKIDMNAEVDIEELAIKLASLGYKRRSLIQAKGEFSIRGDIIDIFQIQDEMPTRIELFDIEVDSMRKFDISTQMSTENIDSVEIYPIFENLIKEDEKINIINKIKTDINKSVEKFDEKVRDRANQKFNRIIDAVEYNQAIDNMDLVIPYIENSASIFDFLAKNAYIIFDDIANQISIEKEMENFNALDIQSRIESGDLLNSHHEINFRFEDLALNNRYQKLNISRLMKSLGEYKIDKIHEIRIRENQNYHGNINNFLDDIRYQLKNDYTINIFAEDKESTVRINKILEENELSSKMIQSIDEDKLSKINIYPYHLDNGFDYYEDKFNFISYNQIFKKANKKKSKTVKNKEIINYEDLVHGDLLVHDNYGIGKYLGIKNIELNGNKSDFIQIEFSQGDKLFVPTSDMSMVSKFIGNQDKQPKLSNLNGTDWKRSKNRAKKAIEEIAEDLVKLYAKRTQIDGFRYSPDTSWQREFEDNFEFVETDAQLRAVREIKEDMQSNKAMDRLLAGDVGYGKTEVALRAAFKAIMDSKQVVMLAPTTILVKQHFNTMQKRFKDYPIKIDYLSRFKTPKEKAQVIEALRKGELDFVVGTHSLLTDKIKFKNLGLLIIDEEQRFGVRHKEKIKEISEEIDVLTLSATPIPRTLQLSLSGIRNMSILDEYPKNRLPINTYVMEYDDVYIREAILKELSRNGQIYFVYNRVNNINKIYKHLIELVPEANIAISHGQMSTRELENVLDDFSNKKYDVLLTTTIIETGMDIQNVNTIIVYNADMMGLSQLYQLKGRVGRSDRNSYAYFTYQKGKVMTEIAEKRLKAIKDFSELGSGYKVAMRDLELRGAGNLLGESQSGHIESIGYDLYVRMLKEKIDEIKGIKTFKPVENIKIDLNLDLYIPSDYIEDENEKINMYKKISYIENKDDHYAIIDELTDRFGDIPKPVQNILDLAYIKSLLVKLGISELIEFDSELMLRYTDLAIFDFDKLKILAKEYKGEMRFELVDKPSIYISNGGNYIFRTIDLLELMEKIIEEKI